MVLIYDRIEFIRLASGGHGVNLYTGFGIGNIIDSGDYYFYGCSLVIVNGALQ